MTWRDSRPGIRRSSRSRSTSSAPSAACASPTCSAISASTPSTWSGCTPTLEAVGLDFSAPAIEAAQNLAGRDRARRPGPLRPRRCARRRPTPSAPAPSTWSTRERAPCAGCRICARGPSSAPSCSRPDGWLYVCEFHPIGVLPRRGPAHRVTTTSTPSRSWTRRWGPTPTSTRPRPQPVLPVAAPSPVALRGAARGRLRAALLPRVGPHPLQAQRLAGARRRRSLPLARAGTPPADVLAQGPEAGVAGPVPPTIGGRSAPRRGRPGRRPGPG